MYLLNKSRLATSLVPQVARIHVCKVHNRFTGMTRIKGGKLHEFQQKKLYNYALMSNIMPNLGLKRYSTDRNQANQNENNIGATSLKIINFLNTAFTKYPHETCVSMLSMEILSIYGTHSLLVYSGVTVPVEFAVAFAMGRPLRRLRLPVELAGAALLSRYFPALTKIQITALSNVFPESMRSQFREGKLKAGAEGFAKIVDKYGASYFISARWVGVSVVCLFYSGVVTGVDVSSYLAKFGFDSFGDVLGTWAAAVTMSAALYPATILCGGGLAHLIAKVTRR